ncbi:MAG: minor capsid protein [Clostridia bacterium]|nr:minor capsid protein [Clostridia bacterium]
MNETIYDKMADNLLGTIDNDIAYVYSTFIPDGTKNILGKMKSNINISDRTFLDKSTQAQVGYELILPYDVLMDKVEAHIREFYDEFAFNRQTHVKLSRYGSKGEAFQNQFQKNLEAQKNNSVSAILRELDLQIMQNKNAKAVIWNTNTLLQKRLNTLKHYLIQTAGQMERYMILWEYQEQGGTHYRFIANGDNCEDCTSLDGKVFPIDDAKTGINLAPMHPNCDCGIEILDASGNTVFSMKKKEEDTEENVLDYLQTTLKQIIFGNYADDANLLGTVGQVALGFIGLDLPADIRDLFYDVTNWKTTWGHLGQTVLDLISLLPYVGSLKYSDEAIDALNAAGKHADEMADATKAAAKQMDELTVELNITKNLKPKDLMDELATSGVKYSPENVVTVTKNVDGKILWLEHGNKTSGLIHILERHANDFAQNNIQDIPSFLNKVLKTKPVKIGNNAKGMFADYVFEQNTYRVAYGTNGYIVSFYPVD